LFSDLGRLWYKQFYHRIVASLRFSFKRDVLSRDTLSSLLSTKTLPNFSETSRRLFEGAQSILVVFNGPRLRREIEDLGEAFVGQANIVAADGAANVLGNLRRPLVLVSDLDSALYSIMLRSSETGLLFAHAHGDNIGKLLQTVPTLGTQIVGTTQVQPSKNVVNFGGFMDGDRACYIASYLGFREIILLGVNFRQERS
jgi:uncharacterized Rossmann fold enzyme